jgi:hypothetical protein
VVAPSARGWKEADNRTAALNLAAAVRRDNRRDGRADHRRTAGVAQKPPVQQSLWETGDRFNARYHRAAGTGV